MNNTADIQNENMFQALDPDAPDSWEAEAEQVMDQKKPTTAPPSTSPKERKKKNKKGIKINPAELGLFVSNQQRVTQLVNTTATATATKPTHPRNERPIPRDAPRDAPRDVHPRETPARIDPTKLRKTKPCIFVVQGGKCPRETCDFAHSLEELNPAECVYGPDCRLLEPLRCPYWHSEHETREKYLTRTQKADFFTRARETRQNETRQNETRIVETRQSETRANGTTFASVLSRQSQTTPHVISCPDHLMERALIVALKAGITNIKIVPLE